MDVKNRRKILNFSVNRKLQLRLFIKILGIATIGVVIMATVFYLYSNREIGNSYRQFHIHANNFLELLFPAAISSMILAIVAAIVITLFLPVRIAGPLYRIERDLKDRVSQGDLTMRLKLRKGDEFGELADTINMTIDSLRQKIDMIVQPAEELVTRIKAGDGNANKEIEILLNKMKEGMKGIKVK